MAFLSFLEILFLVSGPLSWSLAQVSVYIALQCVSHHHSSMAKAIRQNVGRAIVPKSPIIVPDGS